MASTSSDTSPKLRRAKRTPLLPEGLGEFLRLRLVELLGVAVLLGGLFLLMALATFNPADPSLNNATDMRGTNWMGLPGAYVSDLLLQTLGPASWLLAICLLTWSWRIISHRGLPLLWLHLMLLPMAIVLATVYFAALPPDPAWPLEAGRGGVIGLYLLREIEVLLALLGLTWPGWAYATVAGVCALVVLLFALGISRAEWRALFRNGWRGVVLLVSLARGGVSALRETRARQEAEDVVRERQEPQLEPRKRTIRKKPDRVAEPPAPLKAGSRARKERQPKLALEPSGPNELPPLSLLEEPHPDDLKPQIDKEGLEQNARMLESVLDDFGIQGDITNVRPGPVVTLYELEPAPGTKSSRVIGLADDIARSMSAMSARVAVVPGRNAIGIELPNAKRQAVMLREMLSSPAYEKSSARLPLVLGKDIGGTPVIADLATMPHLLIAGTTGSGKSVGINTMIMSLVYRLTPAECRFIMIDPKMLELSVYEGLPHLLTPVVTDPSKAVVALKWAVREMEDRYKAMAKLSVRNLAAYNERLAQAAAKGEVISRTVQTGFDRETGQPIYEQQDLDLTPLPLIVVIVDEMADLMMVAGKDVEGSIQRLAQMARAAGIHLIMATQRPSVDVITGTIKANFPTRISFQVTSKIDSRTILGEQGAEQLLGKGDMLFLAGGGRLTRVHGPFVSDAEVEEVANFLKAQGTPDYLADVTEDVEGSSDPFSPESSGDDLYDQAVALVAREGKASTSFVQRHLQIGYNRAARIIEQMEKEGVIGPANHVGKREVLVGDHSGN